MGVTGNIAQLLNLKTNDSIGEELAQRQEEVIKRGYEFLKDSKNNVLYIADEVGLGKTYIAAGIMTLLRHYSETPSKHKDLIIVPKKNLQEKWFKELRGFTEKNYLGDRSSFRSYYDDKERVIKQRLYSIDQDQPVSIFRMTSFSGLAAYRGEPAKLRNSLISDVFQGDEYAETILLKAKDLGWFNKSKQRELKHLVAYLLNILSPAIDTLVVDEAHNYKKGYGKIDHYESIRNECTARFLGAIKDKVIFEEFPEIENKVKFPLVSKVICLSATPKDNSLLEIKNQLNCFSSKHLLEECQTEDDIAKKLNSFLIRGNLEYNVQNQMVSRNKCIHEHRKGNVDCREESEFLELNDDFESVFWQLLQYKTIKHLDKEYSASFEIGMLSGFETYDSGIQSRFGKGLEEHESDESSSKEYDLIESRTKHKSQDLTVVSSLISSYQKSFDDLPPHPKQSRLIIELEDQISNQEKSLIFARRVPTVYELSSRLLHRYEKEVVIKQQLEPLLKNKITRSNELKNLIKLHADREVLENIEEIAEKLIKKSLVKNFLNQTDCTDLRKIEWFTYAFIESNERKNDFTKEVKRYFTEDLTNVSKKFQLDIISALKKYKTSYFNDVSSDEPDEKTKYFFLDYFKKGGIEKHKYRPKLLRENWFDINPVQLMKKFGNEEFEWLSVPANQELESKKRITKRKRYTDALDDFIESEAENDRIIKFSSELESSTEITQILIQYCANELEEWFNADRRQELDILKKDLAVLGRIILNIFRNGSGLLVGYIAEKSEEDFHAVLEFVLAEQEGTFGHVLDEIKTVINDFDLIVQQNFNENNTTETLKRVDDVYKSVAPIYGTTGKDKIDKSLIAARFRLPGFPYSLITTDIFREGEDLHTYCQNVYHYGIAWNPSDMQQRTGRVDRINSQSYRKIKKSDELDFTNKVQVFYPYLKDSIEVNQVVKLLGKVDHFIKTFNDLESDNYELDSKNMINEEVLINNIPIQFTERVNSKYDIDKFLG